MKGIDVAQAKVIVRKAERHWLDRVAMVISGLCVIHCMATSVILVLLASAGGMLFNPLIHEAGLAIAIVLAAIALGRGWRRHRAPWPAVTGGCGLGLMAAALLVPHGAGETVLTIIGVSLVALGHHLNRRALG